MISHLILVLHIMMESELIGKLLDLNGESEYVNVMQLAHHQVAIVCA